MRYERIQDAAPKGALERIVELEELAKNERAKIACLGFAQYFKEHPEVEHVKLHVRHISGGGFAERFVLAGTASFKAGRGRSNKDKELIHEAQVESILNCILPFNSKAEQERLSLQIIKSDRDFAQLMMAPAELAAWEALRLKAHVKNEGEHSARASRL